MPTRKWIDLAQGLGHYLAPDSEGTVTFFLGAGASQSSGAPATETVYDALVASYPELEANLEEGLDAISEPQVENCIAPLFEDVRPGIGYLSLAGLAKSTRVLVVNLNWDSAIEDACEIEGVECASVVLDEANDLEGGLSQIKECLEDHRYRVVNLHLHGRIGHGDIRLARKNTLSFLPETTKLLWNSFFRHPTVVAGASLTGEYDVTGLLTSTAMENHKQKKSPFWLFSRQPERTDQPEDAVAADLLSRKDSSLNFAGDPFIDFDRLMIEVLARKTGRHLKDSFGSPGPALPKAEDIVLPAPRLLSRHLQGPSAGRALAFVGERKIGKSTTARMLSHWISARSLDVVPVHTHFGKGNCAEAVSTMLERRWESEPVQIAIFDDPFGNGEAFDANQSFVEGLLKLLDIDGTPRVMITCSPANWHLATTENPELLGLVDVVAAKPTSWYRGTDLAALADTEESEMPVMVTRRILEGVCSTPSRVLAANRGVYPDHEDEVIEEKLRLLQSVEAKIPEFLALVRFYELSRTVVPQVDLAASLHASFEDLPVYMRHMLRKSEFDGEPHWQFAHYTDRAAFDRLYGERSETLFPAVVQAAYGRDTVSQVCSVWAVIAAVRAGDVDAIEKLDRHALIEWGPLLLQEAANSKNCTEWLDEILEMLVESDGIDAGLDFWSLRELVYEVVRLWPELHESPVAQRFFAKVLRDRDRLGVYSALEAVLYFQEATHTGTWDEDVALRELWERLSSARWDLINDSERCGMELALMVDALAWARPPITKERMGMWLEPMLDALEVRDESFKGAIALACLYHPEGVKLFTDLGRDSPLADVGNLTEAQMARAAEMVRWHFVHQSRGRALLTRRRLEPARPELLGRVGRARRVPKAHARSIKSFVRRMASFSAHRGWAIHLGCNLCCTAGEFDDTFLGAILEGMREPEDGIVTAALTYRIPDGALEQMQKYFHEEENMELLLAYMLDGYQVSGLFESAEAAVAPPRFMAGRNPYEIHRQLNTQWGGSLAKVDRDPSHPLFQREVHDILIEASDQGHISREAMWDLMHFVSRGVYAPLETEVSREPNERRLANWLRGKSNLTKVVVSVALEIRREEQLDLGDLGGELPT